MIELLVVMGLMMILLAIAAPFASSIRSDISMKKTVRQIKTDIITNIGYSLAGKSIAALSARDLTNPDLIPSHYALYFKSDDDYGDQAPYRYIEMTTEIIDSSIQKTNVLYQIEKEIASPVVYLKDIRLKTSESDTGTSVSSAYIIFTPPFGKIVFMNGYDSLLVDDHETFNPITTFKDADNYKIIELDFQYKDDENSITTLSFSTDKIINII